MDTSSSPPPFSLCNRIRWLLRITLLIQAIGVAWQYYFAEFETESPLFSYLLYERGWSEPVAQRIDNAAALCWLAAAVAIVVVPLFGKRRRSTASTIGDTDDAVANVSCPTRGVVALEATLAVVIFIVQAILVAVSWHRGAGELYNNLLPLGQIARWMTPVLLLLLLPFGSRPVSARRLDAVMWLLRATAAITFIAHGLKAIGGYPAFIDYLLVTANDVLNYEVSEAAMKTLLSVIGWSDILVAILLMLGRWRPLATYMALWAFVAGWSRVVHSGWGSSFEVAIRSGNYCLPLVAAFYFHGTRSGRKSENSEN